MYTVNIDPKLDKEEFYKELLTQINLIIDGERNWVTNLANISSLIFYGINQMDIFKDRINWVGFYTPDKMIPESLILGPFQGKVACIRIKYGRGVCGTAAATRQAQVVQETCKFPGHIACDPESKSEIVLPILCHNGEDIVGVLDIDSTVAGTFDEEDRVGLQKIVESIAAGCDW